MIVSRHVSAISPNRQLKYDGFETAAAQLADTIPKAVLGSSERLGHLVKLGLEAEGGELLALCNIIISIAL